MELISLIQNGANYLQPYVQGILSAIFTTLFVRQKTSNEQFEAIKAGKFSLVIDTLLEQGKMTYYEYYKCNNFLNIAHLADTYIEEENNTKGQENNSVEFDLDWFLRFFESASEISNSDLQILWAKILARKICDSETCSYRTLRIMHDLTPIEANIFNELCKYVVITGDCYFIFADGFFDDASGNFSNYINSKGLKYSVDILTMVECGLFTLDNDIISDYKTNDTLAIKNDKIIALTKAKESCLPIIHIVAYTLTSSGIELFNIIRKSTTFSPDIEYAKMCLSELKRQNNTITVTAHLIQTADDGILQYNMQDILD